MHQSKPFRLLQLTIALGLVVPLAACQQGLSLTDESEIDRWLTCIECTDGERESVARIASFLFGTREEATVNRLVEAMRGPRPEHVRNMQSRFANDYARLSAPTISATEYVQRFEDNYRAMHQKRAVLALGDIGTQEALAAIAAELATPAGPYRTDVRVLMQDVLDARTTATARVVAAVTQTTFALRTSAEVRPPPAVIVTDLNGNPVANEQIKFDATAGSSIARTTVRTNSSGIASVGSWRVGSSAGADSVRAIHLGLSQTVVFTASVTDAVRLEIFAGNNQSAPFDSNVPVPPEVLVSDASGGPVAGVTVTFTVIVGGGAVAGATVSTDVNGRARVGGWGLGPAAGPNGLIAAVGGLAPVVFVATATP